MFARVLGFSFLMLLCHAASAQPADYIRIEVKGKVQLELPEDWTVNGRAHREWVRDLSSKMTGDQNNHTASLSASSWPPPSKLFVRVSFIPMNPPITQAEFKALDAQAIVKESADAWQSEAPEMWSNFAKVGIKPVGVPSFKVEPIGGRTAMAIRYARTLNPKASPGVMLVEQYHVPMGAEKVLVTLSYIDGDPEAARQHARIKKGIQIR